MSARMVGEPRVELSRAALHLALARSFELPEAERGFLRRSGFRQVPSGCVQAAEGGVEGVLEAERRERGSSVESVAAKVTFEQKGSWFDLTEIAETRLGARNFKAVTQGAPLWRARA
jgi:hypothetical protein